jgi:inosine/xanthosine triphosphate pyrophosphatase family protein
MSGKKVVTFITGNAKKLEEVRNILHVYRISDIISTVILV